MDQKQETKGGDVERKVQIREEHLRPETERERQHFHARPSGDQKVAEFMEEHDDGQDEQKRNDVADEPMAQRSETI